MERKSYRLRLRLVKLMAAAAMVLPFAACWYLYYANALYMPFYKKGNWLVIALFAAVYIVLARIYDAFRISTKRITDMVYSQVLAAFLTDGVLYVVIWLLMRKLPNPLPGMAAMAAQLLLATGWSWWAHNWYFHQFPPKKSAIVFDKHYDIENLVHEYGLEKKFDIRLTVSVADCIKDVRMLEGMETVFISGVQSHERNVVLKYCVARGIPVYVLPRIGDIILSGAERMHMFHLPMLRVDRTVDSLENACLKRCFDILVSAVALIVASPIMLVTAAAIKLGDGGPVFYKQARLTKGGKIFHVLKFRSMRVDAEKDGVARLSTGDKDDRITPVGRIIRKVRIDELPQLLNILGGSMSVVGPRPERPEIAQQYEKELPEFRLRLQVKAGLTGYAQVYGKYNTSPYDKLQMDLMYIANPTILEDLRIVLATVKILFMPESTDGIAEGQVNAMRNENNAELVNREPEKDKDMMVGAQH